MKLLYSIILSSLTAPYYYVASQCLIDNPDSISKIELMNEECSYDQVLRKVNKAKNALRDSGVTTCLNKKDELGALLGLSDEGDMIAKVESICDQAISHSRTDADFAIDFKDIPLTDTQNTDAINRFLKEFYDGGKCVSSFLLAFYRMFVPSKYSISLQNLSSFYP